MFYANFVLAKKGPLARVWLAAHWEKKLSKAHVYETDLQSSVESIIAPKVKIALRTSGHLLLGVVRIYSRKAKYLLADCSEALIKIKMAFRPEVVDLPLDNQKAAVSAITLPEFQEWDALMKDMGNFDITAVLNKNQCRVEEITMKEDLIGSRFMSEDNFFGDTHFGEMSDREIMRDEASLNESINMQDMSKAELEDDTTLKDKSTLSLNQSKIDFSMGDAILDDGGFGVGEGLDFLEGFGMEAPEIAGLEDLDRQASLDELDSTLTNKKDKDLKDEEMMDQATKDREVVEEISTIMGEGIEDNHKMDSEDEGEAVPEQTDIPLVTNMETTLFSRDTEAFALEPVEITVGKEKRKKRKRKLIVDEEKIISNDQMKARINNSDDIVKAAVVAPATKIRMTTYDVNVKNLFETPTMFPSKFSQMATLYLHNLRSKIPEDFVIPSSQEDSEIMLEEQPKEVLRDEDPEANELPELTTEITEIEKTNNEEELLEELIEPAPLENINLDENLLEEEPQESITIPPPFELDTNTTKEAELDLEDEPEGGEQTDVLDKRWTKRTQQTLALLQKNLKKKNEVNFKDITKNCTRKQAALKFYTLLILTKEKAIKVHQDEIFADVIIERGANFVQS